MIKKIWAFVVGAFGVLIALFFYQKKRADDAEGELISSKAKEEDAVLKFQSDLITSDKVKERENIKKLEEDAKKPVEDLTPEEVKKHWENK